MSDDSVQFLSNIARTQWVNGSKMQDDVNEMLAQGWVLLAAGVDPYGEPTWLLGWSYLADTRPEALRRMLDWMGKQPSPEQDADHTEGET